MSAPLVYGVNTFSTVPRGRAESHPRRSYRRGTHPRSGPDQSGHCQTMAHLACVRYHTSAPHTSARIFTIDITQLSERHYREQLR